MTSRRKGAAGPLLSVAFILLPEFTLSALAGFVDTMRLSADDNFESGQKYCKWTILGFDLNPVRSSSGAEVGPWEKLRRPIDFDCLVVVGGLVKGHRKIDRRITDYIAEVHADGKLVVGLCTGSFALAYAGLMKDKTTCVHWFHKPDFETAFPDHHCVTDVVFYEDRGCITCAGGGVSGDVAANVVERFCGKALARMGASGMLMETPKGIRSPQPHLEADWFHSVARMELRTAILTMDGAIRRAFTVETLAKMCGLGKSKLDRLFRAQFSVSAALFSRVLRLAHANREVIYTDRKITDIAMEFGFSDASHFCKLYHELVLLTPTEVRKQPRDLALGAINRNMTGRADIVRELMAGKLFFSSEPAKTGAFARYGLSDDRPHTA